MIKDLWITALQELNQAKRQILIRGWLPMLVILLTYIMMYSWSWIPSDEKNPGISGTTFLNIMALLGINFIAHTFLAIRVHQTLLLPKSEASQLPLLKLAGLYLIWASVIFIAAFLIAILPAVLISPIVLSAVTHSNQHYWIAPGITIILFLLFTAYPTARMSLVLPDRAIGRKTPFKHLWFWSDARGWKIATALILLPAVLTTVVDWVFSDQDSLIGNLVYSLLTIPLLIISIALLSVCYRGLKAERETEIAHFLENSSTEGSLKE